MFRRQTDEVFSTLQQVQRRLSQHTQTGDNGTAVTSPDQVGPTSQPPEVASTAPPVEPGGDFGPSAPPKTFATVSRPPAPGQTPPPQGDKVGSSKYGKEAFRVHSSGAPVPSHVRPVGGPRPTEEFATNAMGGQLPNRRGIVVSPQLGVSLLVFLVLSHLVTWYIASSPGGLTPAGPPPQAAVGPAGTGISHTPPPPGGDSTGPGGGSEVSTAGVSTTSRLGDDVLVLQSVRRETASGRQQFEALRDVLNRNAQEKGLRPYFGVRVGPSGNMMLVYGEVSRGVFGIDRNSERSKAVYTQMRNAKNRSGKKPFSDAYWVGINK